MSEFIRTFAGKGKRQMKKKEIYTGICLLGLLLSMTACDALYRKHQAGAAVELDGQFLFYTTLDSLTRGLTAEDSASVASQYIRQWAKDILVYDEARDVADEQIEALVEDYRRSLYVHAYEQQLVARRMPVNVADTLVEQIYNTHIDRFILRESIVKGMLLVVPNGAPNLPKLRRWMLLKDEDDMENIEKYAYRYATGYELFTDQWLTAQQLLLYMPFEQDVLDAMLSRQTQIELQDSLSTFILQVTDKHLAGTPMPMDYARPEIEQLILSRRQVDFLRQERERLYDEAVKYKKIRFYEHK